MGGVGRDFVFGGSDFGYFLLRVSLTLLLGSEFDTLLLRFGNLMLSVSFLELPRDLRRYKQVVVALGLAGSAYVGAALCHLPIQNLYFSVEI